MYSVLLFFHFIGLALGIGTGFAFTALGIASKDLPPKERVAFLLRGGAIGKNGSIGLALLIATGIGMTLMRGVPETFAWGGGAFHAKLGLVVVFIALFGYMQALSARARREGGGAAMSVIPKVAFPLQVIGLAIVACAVAAFH